MQQPQESIRQRPDEETGERKVFWIRVGAVVVICLGLLVLGVIEILALGHEMDYNWVYIAPVIFVVAGTIVAVCTYILPFDVVTWRRTAASAGPASGPSDAATDVAANVVVPAGVANASAVQSVGAGSAAVPVIVAPLINVFHFNEPVLPAPEELYGRAYERLTLRERISKRSSTAIVGERRIGKSWLMQYVQQTASKYELADVRVRVGRVSATSALNRTLADFVKEALKELGAATYKYPAASSPLSRLTLAARMLKEQSILAVLCIDEFEGLLGKPGFDKGFLEELRTVAQDEGLVLIATNRQPIHQVIEHLTGATSPLFNIMPELVLNFFTEQEAQQFVNEKSVQAGLDQGEQDFLLECAAQTDATGGRGWPPMHLQLVGSELAKAKYLGATGQGRYDLGDAAYRLALQQRIDTQYKKLVRP